MRQQSSDKKEPTLLEEPDRFLVEVAGDVRDRTGDIVEGAVSFARREPKEALIWALAAGYVLRILPLTRIVRFFLVVALGLVKPLSFFFGAIKTYQQLSRLMGGSARSREKAAP
jgi:hypothetical protein